MPPKTKTAFQLDTPYAEPSWPQISAQDQDTIIALLVNLFSPIGIHRKTFTKPSQGKRKRSKSFKKGHGGEEQNPSPKPEAPPISSQVLIGLNSITRHLSSSSATSCPSTLLPPNSTDTSTASAEGQEENGRREVGEKSEKKREPATHMSILFTTRQPIPPLSSHLPMLAHTASLSHSDKPATRLVVLPPKAETKICEALGIARAGFIGLLEGDGNGNASPSGMNALVELVREKVPAIDPGEWLEEGIKEYRETRINAVQVPVPVAQNMKPKKEVPGKK